MRPADHLPTTLTFATCVESGILEPMAVRWAESLRRFGGRLATAPVIAVTPRLGPPLSAETRARFRDLDVQTIRTSRPRSYGWYHFLNKPRTLCAAEEVADTDCLAWFDADTIVLDEPNALLLPLEVEFAACPPDNDIIGSSGADDPHEPIWRGLCSLAGLDIDSLPWLTTHVERRRIRLYWQGGVLVYRRSSGFARAYLDTCVELLGARRVLSNGAHWLEQIAIGFAMLRSGLRWTELPWSHNYCLISTLQHQFDPAQFRDARVLHHHDSMNPEHWDHFLTLIRTHRPELEDWMTGLGPVRSTVSPFHRSASEALRVARGLPRRIHRLRSEVLLPTGDEALR